MNNLSTVLVALNNHGNLIIRTLHSILERIEGVESRVIFFKHVRFAENSFPSRREEEYFVRMIKQWRPRLVGFQVLTPHVFLARYLTKVIKAIDPGIVVVWGGAHPSMAPETCIADTDILCLGEGEAALAELAQCLRDNRSYDQIQNLWINKGAGQVIKNPLRKLNEDLDSIPFPSYGKESYFFINANRMTQDDPLIKQDLVQVLTGRGCPFGCPYCYNSALNELHKGLGPWVRRRSVSHVLEELKMIKEMKKGAPVYIAFCDENFLINPFRRNPRPFGREEKELCANDGAGSLRDTNNDWVKEFLERYPKEIGLPFGIQSHPRTFTPQMIQALAKAKVTRIALGIESGSQEIRSGIFNRDVSNQEIIDLSWEIARQGIARTYYFIMNNPYETSASLREAIQLFLRLPRPFELRTSHLFFFPNTPILRRAIKDNKISPQQAAMGHLIRQTQRIWRYQPQAFPFNSRIRMQNLIWLLGHYSIRNQLDRKEKIFQNNVIGHSWFSPLMSQLMNLEAVFLGRIYGRAGLLKRYPALEGTGHLFKKALGVLAKGDWKGFIFMTYNYFAARYYNQRNRLASESAAMLRIEGGLDDGTIQSKA